MDELESLSHTKWECKYHVVFIPKCRRKTLYGELIPFPDQIDFAMYGNDVMDLTSAGLRSM